MEERAQKKTSKIKIVVFLLAAVLCVAAIWFSMRPEQFYGASGEIGKKVYTEVVAVKPMCGYITSENYGQPVTDIICFAETRRYNSKDDMEKGTAFFIIPISEYQRIFNEDFTYKEGGGNGIMTNDLTVRMEGKLYGTVIDNDDAYLSSYFPLARVFIEFSKFKEA